MSLKDKKIIVTGGPTREWIDPVRFISNPSTGKMGIAIADAASHRSNDTIFIHGPIDNHLLNNKKFQSILVETTKDLLHAVLKEITKESILIMAAAPADYAPKNKSKIKIKKENSSDDLVLTMIKNPDILKEVAREKKKNSSLKDLFVVGFAAETNDIENNTLKKLRSKNLNMICLNDVTKKNAGFGSDSNLITIYTKDNKKIKLPMLSKSEAANRILNQVELEINK